MHESNDLRKRQDVQRVAVSSKALERRRHCGRLPAREHGNENHCVADLPRSRLTVHVRLVMASRALSASRPPRLPLRIAELSVRRYAVRKEVVTDPIKENIRKALYPPNIRNRASPTGTWRPDIAQALQVAVPSKQVHETIERAWKLHVRHIRKRRDAELQRKFDCMKRAMEELWRIDKELYIDTNRPFDPRERREGEMKWLQSLKVPQRRAYESRVKGLFPRELRPPMDTPSRDGWKYEFAPTIPILPAPEQLKESS
jgi:large subunit ribosomal protein L40